MDINEILKINSKAVEEKFHTILSSKDLPQQAVYESMLYSLMAGGKRLRPTLVIEFCKACGGSLEDALDFACAVEMVHTYSLIHDDLPCMDDDDFRRGKPTNHLVYGEAVAVLAGDALLTQAFEVIAISATDNTMARSAILTLSRAIGAMGMVGGQILDMEGENKNLTLDELKLMHSLKTGALFSASAKLGCIAAGASAYQTTAAEKYARSLGLAFQIRDDMLDVIGDEEQLGKATGADASRGKSTFLSLLGLEQCAQAVLEETEKAKAALSDNLFDNQFVLCGIADMLAERMK